MRHERTIAAGQKGILLHSLLLHSVISLFFFLYQEDVAVLRDRLYNAQYPSHANSSIKPPTFPFPRVDVKAAPAEQPEVRKYMTKEPCSLPTSIYSCLRYYLYS